MDKDRNLCTYTIPSYDNKGLEKQNENKLVKSFISSH